MTTPTEYQPDPFALQITSLVIHRRAEFLPHIGPAFAELVGLAADFDRYGNLLAQLRGVPTPFDPKAKEVPTSVEVFLKTDEFVGYTQRVPRPSVGMDIRHFRLAARSEAAKSRLGPTPKMAGALAVMDLIQHPGLQWEVMHAEVAQQYRRRGFATMLYDHIEEILGTTLRASGWLSFDRLPLLAETRSISRSVASRVGASTGPLGEPQAIAAEIKLMDTIENYRPT
jgi:ribosomal protein S18 acetylase RimI-like enzyme